MTSSLHTSVTVFILRIKVLYKWNSCSCYSKDSTEVKGWGQNVDQGSMDPHSTLDRVHGPLSWTGSMAPCHGPGPGILFLSNENWTKTEIVQKKRFDKMLFISLQTLRAYTLTVARLFSLCAPVQRLALWTSWSLEFIAFRAIMTDSHRNSP